MDKKKKDKKKIASVSIRTQFINFCTFWLNNSPSKNSRANWPTISKQKLIQFYAFIIIIIINLLVLLLFNFIIKYFIFL